MTSNLSETYPLLILPALDNSRMRSHVGGVTPPKIDPHLQIADHHPQHRKKVSDKEEDNVVP